MYSVAVSVFIVQQTELGGPQELSSVQASYIIDYLLVLIQSVLQHARDHSHKTPKNTQNACTSQPVHDGHVAGTQKQIKRIKALQCFLLSLCVHPFSPFQ